MFCETYSSNMANVVEMGHDVMFKHVFFSRLVCGTCVFSDNSTVGNIAEAMSHNKFNKNNTHKSLLCL